MIADALRYHVEFHAERTRAGSLFLRRARAGDATPTEVGRYLAGLRFMIGQTNGNMTKAEGRARAQGREDLAAYYVEKRREEDGHEQWAIDDLAAFFDVYGFRPDDEPVPALRELQRFLVRTIDEDPTLYLAYIFWAEYFVVLVGAEFIRSLVEHCGLLPETLTCLGNHVVLDEGHTDQNIAEIDRLVADPQYLEPMRAVLQRTIDLFDLSTQQMLDPVTAKERVAS
jgi:hypothetical protein